MGLSNFLKKKFEGSTKQKVVKVAQATKHGAEATYKATQKAINSPHLETIGRAAKGVSSGLETGAAAFNKGVGADTWQQPKFSNDLFDLDLKHGAEHQHRYESKRERRRRRNHERHEHREPMLGDLY